MSYGLSNPRGLLQSDPASTVKITDHLSGSNYNAVDIPVTQATGHKPLVTRSFGDSMCMRFWHPGNVELASAHRVSFAGAMAPSEQAISAHRVIAEIQGSLTLGVPVGSRLSVSFFYGFMTPTDLNIAANGAWSTHNLPEHYGVIESGRGQLSGGGSVGSFSNRIAYTPDKVLLVGVDLTNHSGTATTLHLDCTLYGWRWVSDYIHFDPNTG